MEYLHDCITELQKSTKERNSEKIIKYIQSLSSFMLLIKEEQNRNRDHLENTVKILHYIRKEKNNIIVREGEKGNEFFLILRGKVAILVFQPEYGHKLILLEMTSLLLVYFFKWHFTKTKYFIF